MHEHFVLKYRQHSKLMCLRIVSELRSGWCRYGQMKLDINYRRIGLQAAFWAVMFILLLMILSNFVNISNTNQLSAYDDDWDDMSAFRQDINDMGIEN